MPGIKAQLPYGKVNHFGIEVTDNITWRAWEAGCEVTKTIVLKNVCVKTKKLKFKSPQTRFFATLYPQTIVLSAGTSFTLPVTFRPLEKVLYKDKVEFITDGSSFRIPLEGLLPELDICVPQTVNFGMCAVADVVQLTFELENRCEVLTPFRVEAKEPFAVEPFEGLLDPFSKITILASFRPKNALVYVGDIQFRYGKDGYDQTRISIFEGIGKYPHLVVSGSGISQTEGRNGGQEQETVVNFDTVSVGQSVQKWIELTNMAPVNAPFQIDHPASRGRVDTVFRCVQKQGIVPANSVIRVPMTFAPSTVDATSVDYFHVIPIGSISRTVIKCIGLSKGPHVVLSRNVINFNQVDGGATATAVLDIINASDTDATFQFAIDCSESVFKFETICGHLPRRQRSATSKKTVIIHFQPTHPINYHRRVSCLIHNQEPLFLDLIGTCHTELMKPAILQPRHLTRYQTHVDRGLSFIPPEQLNEMVQVGQLAADDDGALYSTSGEKPEENPVCLNPMDEYFNDGYHSETTYVQPHVSLSNHEVDFGQCSDLLSVDPKDVTITNHTKGKVIVVWMGDESHNFSVTPNTVDIAPLSSACFRITFRPSETCQFYGAQLECFVYYKSLRDYRLVEDATHFPPWCLTLTAIGHTFAPHFETFLPRASVNPDRLVFPAVNTNDTAYRTVMLANQGTTPIVFDLEHDPNKIFSMKPTKGMIPPSRHQLFVMKLQPREVKTYKHTLKLRLNAAEKHTQEIPMQGSAEEALILLDTNGEMFFKPTAVNSLSKRQYGIRNLSRIPLCFEWKMHAVDAEVLSVEPVTGVIEPNEKMFHKWYFRPKEADKKYVMRPTLLAWGKGQNTTSSGGKCQQFIVRSIGEGVTAAIRAEVPYVDYGPVMVGSTISKELVLLNDGQCSLHYKLHVEQSIDNTYNSSQFNTDPVGLQLEWQYGVLAARSKCSIGCLVRPVRRLFYKWTVHYQLLQPEDSQGDREEEEEGEKHFLCHILAAGMYPSIAVCDARCYGSTKGLSKKQLWDLFSLDDFNTVLDGDPASAELRFSTSRLGRIDNAISETRAILDFNFSSAPVDSEPSYVELMLENTGSIICEWSFLFPNDVQEDLEYWAETGDLDDQELHEMKVQDNKLFVIEPKKGKLQPGENQVIKFTYKHIMAGTDRLPVLFKVARGREILYGLGRNITLNFIGVTVERDRRYIHFNSDQFMFSPVPIGQKNCPVQVYELFNGGAMPVKYSFGLAQLEYLNQANYNYKIYECLTPNGEILPGETAKVEWKFSPLEAKMYTVDVPIRIHNADTAVITFTGAGYDQRAMGETMPFNDRIGDSNVPLTQLIHPTGQLCYLSKERISLGNVPLFSQCRYLVALVNRSAGQTAAFKWYITSKKDQKYVSVTPNSGLLKPGVSQACKVTFTALGPPSFFDIDLVCEVVSKTEQETYLEQMAAWEKEQERQIVEFTITEDDINADQRIAVVEPSAAQSATQTPHTPSSTTQPQQSTTEVQSQAFVPSSRLRAVSTDAVDPSPLNSGADLLSNKWKPDGGVDERPSSVKSLKSLEVSRTPSPEISRYKTLPPIKQQSVDDVRQKKKQATKMLKSFWPTPQPPKPFLLHLGVTARTHDISEFQQNFRDEYDHFFIDRLLSESTEEVGNANIERDDDKIACLKSESEIVADVLTDVIRGLLEDTSFHAACDHVFTEPIPYFQQYSDKGPTKRIQSAATSDTSFSVNLLSPKGSILSLTATMAPFEEDPASPSVDLPPTTADTQASAKSSSSHPRPMELARSSEKSATVGQSSRAASTRPSGTKTDDIITRSYEVEREFSEKQAIKKMSEFGNFTESLLENTLTNIMQEAFSEEFQITARPRLVALPPRSSSTKSLSQRATPSVKPSSIKEDPVPISKSGKGSPSEK